MLAKKQLIDYAVRSIDDILNTEGVYVPEEADYAALFRGGFSNSTPLRKTQGMALVAWRNFLLDEKLPEEERLQGFFSIPTGIGKTAIFVKSVAGMHRYALQDGFNINTRIVFPKTNLVSDTEKKGFGRYAPDMLPHIGQYSEERTELDKPITLMTFVAWQKLVSSGQINGDNTDILIFDEAHHGLSERRKNSLMSVFNGHTLKMAFTATYAFDEKKTLELTHKNMILERKPGEAIDDGELCDYAHTQHYSFRVPPEEVERLEEELKKQLKDKETLLDTAFIRLYARQKAWNGRAVKIYAEGIDEYSGEALSDNQAGFYVSNIRHANEMEKLLNADPALAEKARGFGCKAVAVAIHSRLTAKEQKLRQDAFEAGEYMAIVGDEKFKEGFDHAPLKTIINWPKGSLIDEAQVLGRAARRWANDGNWFPERKGRQEGMTIIDTTVYIGDEDSEKDEALKERAIKNAILAKDILGDTFVLGKASHRSGGGGGRGVRLKKKLFEDDIEVASSTELEEMKTFVSKRQKLIDEADFIYTIEDVLESARVEVEATGFRPTTSKNNMFKYGPLKEKITCAAVNAAIRGGRLKDCGYSSLVEALDKNGIVNKNPYPIEDILESARLEVEATGNRPTNSTHQLIQLIQYGPLKDKISWSGLSMQIRLCSLGENDRWGPEISGCSSLSELLDKYASQGSWGIKTNNITLDQIEKSARETLKATGKRPSTTGRKLVEYGPLKDKTSWDKIDWGFRNKKIIGEKGESYGSLKDFLKAKNIISILSEQDILQSALATLEAIGKRPSIASGLVKFGPLKDKVTWAGLNINIIRKANGCEDWSYKNLVDFLNQNNVPKTLDKKPKPKSYGGGWMAPEIF